MNLYDYRRSLNMNNGQRHSYEAQDIIEHTWYDDPANMVAYFYDYEHDDEKDKNIGLHPECSKTKIPVEIKYILSSYRTLNKDEVDSRIMFKPSVGCPIPYYEDKIGKQTGGTCPVGLYVDIKDEKGVWKKWLVVSTASANNDDFPTWSILPCGHRFQWVYDGKKYQMWGVERSQSSYTSGVWLDRVYESPDNITKCIMPYNDITTTFFYNTRIIISVEGLITPLAWRVTKVEPIASRGTILYTFKEDIFDQHHDYIEYDEDGNLIGMWANYFKDTNLPTQPDEPTPILDDIYAEITYSGKEPHIKVNGGYKAITIQYYSKTTEIVDQTPGNWEFYIDQVEVSDLIKVMETDTPNTIKIKFLGNEEFLGNVLTVKNTRDEIIGKLNLEITSL